MFTTKEAAAVRASEKEVSLTAVGAPTPFHSYHRSAADFSERAFAIMLLGQVAFDTENPPTTFAHVWKI
ncbi:MAG: hypothetical protein QXW41_09345 [Fervidicoccaceae archaeon]